MKRLLTLLVVSLALICITPLDGFCPPQVPVPDGGLGGTGGQNPIDGGLGVLALGGAALAFYSKKRLENQN